MRKPILTSILLVLFAFAYSQQEILILKKGNRSVEKFWKGTFIAFQLENKNWEKGEIMKIKGDSFYIRPRVIKYSLMGTDTFYYPVKGFVTTDIYAMPKRGVLIDFVNGRFQISRTGGHQHFYWVKSGFIFRVAGAGFTILSLANGTLAGAAIGAGVFAGGFLMKKIYKLTIRMRGKNKIVVVNFSPVGIKK